MPDLRTEFKIIKFKDDIDVRKCELDVFCFFLTKAVWENLITKSSSIEQYFILPFPLLSFSFSMLLARAFAIFICSFS